MFHSIFQFPFTVPIREVHGHAVSKISQILHGSCFPPTGPVSDWISQGSLHLDRRSENITLSYAGSNDYNALLHPSFLSPIHLLIREKKSGHPTLACSDSGRASMSTADTSVTDHNIAIITLVAKQKTQGDKFWTSLHSRAGVLWVNMGKQVCLCNLYTGLHQRLSNCFTQLIPLAASQIGYYKHFLTHAWLHLLDKPAQQLKEHNKTLLIREQGAKRERERKGMVLQKRNHLMNQRSFTTTVNQSTKYM